MKKITVQRVPKIFYTKNQAYAVSKGNMVVKWFKYKKNATAYANRLRKKRR